MSKVVTRDEVVRTGCVGLGCGNAAEGCVINKSFKVLRVLSEAVNTIHRNRKSAPLEMGVSGDK
jgi:hypothetical protein